MTLKSFVETLQDRIMQLEKENDLLRTHAPYGILTRAAFELEKRKLTNAQCVVFGDIDAMHQLNTQYGYEAVNAKIRNALHLRNGDTLFAGLWFSGDEIVFIINGDPEGFCERVKQSFVDQGMSITLAFGYIADHGSIDAAIHATADNVQKMKVNRK